MRHDLPIYFTAADAASGGTTDSGSGGESGASDVIPRAEAQKAFKARDEYKAKLRQLEESGRILSDEQIERYKQLEDAAAKAEEDRKRKAGEFDAWRQQIATKHQQELEAERVKAQQVAARFTETVKKAEFGAAIELFGGESAKTILDVELGMAALGKYVEVQDAEDDPRGYRIVVKNPRGEAILGRDGNPAPFGEAMAELIGQLPNKDRILRGSGKTGSGSSGGSTSGGQASVVDIRRPLTPAEMRDPKVREQLRQQMNAAGGLQMGAGIPRR